MKIDFARVVDATSRQFADCEALVNVERKRRYTFCELNTLTNRIVNAMRGPLGLRRGDRYLLILENDNISLIHHWTIFKGEAAAAFTNYRDSLEEHLWQIDWIEPKVVFLEAALLERYYAPLYRRGVRIVSMDRASTKHPGVDYFWDLVANASDALQHAESEASTDILLYRFTGGTTGRGKCAQYTLDNWLACRDSWWALPDTIFTDRTRFLQFAPLSHGAGLMVLPTFFRGGCLVTQNSADISLWCKTVEEERIDTSFLVPTLLYRLLNNTEAEQHDLSSLRTIIYGAAPMSPDKLALLRARFGDIFVQAYAATESVAIVCSLRKSDHDIATNAIGRLASAGRVVPGTEVMIVGSDCKEVPCGEIGELWLRSRGTISGYYRNPEGTAAEFAAGIWKSGDLGYMDESGFVYIVDRKKDMIISGGFNVYAIEVESAINSHPATLMSAVIGIPHEEWGEAVHAEVVLREGAEVSTEELIAHVKARIGSFKAPKSVTIVSELPISAAGKVLRRTVRDRYWEGQRRRVS